MVGGMTQDYWDRDPRRLAFVLARYKFVSRMLEGKRTVLEIGCADGFGSRIVRQKVKELVAIDLDEKSIEEAKARQSPEWPICFMHADFTKERFVGFDAAYALDVIEHVEPTQTHEFLSRMRTAAPLVIVGSPSLESQDWASDLSKAGHVNCMTENALRLAMEKHFRHVFIFGMNDEVVHTGFGPMCHYRFAIGVE
jgi:hypothetical protein